VPKPHGGYRIVVDYWLLNKEVVFDAFLTQTVEHSFADFHKANVFSVLHRNWSYYHIHMSAKSRRATAFCTPLGLFKFNNLPTGIIVDCQVPSMVVDFKQKFVYNFMDDLIVYSSSLTEHLVHLAEVFKSLEKGAGQRQVMPIIGAATACWTANVVIRAARCIILGSCAAIGAVT
jgi:hypothetical protein